MNLEVLHQEIETALRTGKRDLARHALLKVKGKSLPRSKAKLFATLARRAGLLPLALQIMTPIVRPKTKLDVAASAEEIATYSLVLLGLGAVQECNSLLKSVDQNNPDIILASAFACIKTWDYVQAIVFLEKYIASATPSPYAKMIAKVNLAASQIATGQLTNGKILLREILEVTTKEGWLQLNTNALELSIQTAVQEGDWTGCDQILRETARQTDTNPGQVDSTLFLLKWEAIADVMRNKAKQESLLQLRSVRKKAEVMNHWETVRDCDFHEALALQDTALALRVYFGTPFPSYRKRLRDATAGWLTIPNSYQLQFRNSIASHNLGEPIGKRVFQLSSGREIGNEAIALPVGKSLHQALWTLASDSYRPFSVGTLYSEIFKAEHFNPSSSPRRVAFLIHRLRNWFDEHGIPLDVVSNRDGYRLSSTGEYTLELSETKSEVVHPNQISFERLQMIALQSQKSELSIHDIAIAIESSERGARYFLKWAIEHGKLVRTGRGRSIRYKL